MESPKVPLVFYSALAVAGVSLLLTIYYLIPGIYHVPIPDVARPTLVHEKYVELCASIVFLSVLVALISRPRANRE
jgi:hypothetical protein